MEKRNNKRKKWRRNARNRRKSSLCGAMVLFLGAVGTMLWGGGVQSCAACYEHSFEVLRVYTGAEGYTIDPAYLRGEEPEDYLSHLFEGLVKYAPVEPDHRLCEMELIGGLAEHWDISEDGLTYRFYLREDACWSDGQPILASDFVYAWRRLMTQGAHSAGAQRLIGVLRNAEAVAEGTLPYTDLGVRAEGEKLLVAELERPCGHFLKLCGDVSMVPVREDLIARYGGDWTKAEHLVVSGAYMPIRWVHDDAMTLVKNPWYYDGEHLGPHEILWMFDVQEGEAVDVTRCHGGSLTAAVGETYYLYLNAGGIPDWRVRAAMVLSVDRETLVAAVGGGARAAVGMVPNGEDSAEAPLYRWLSEAYPSYDLTSYEGRCGLAQLLYGQALEAGTWYASYEIYQRFEESAENRLVAEHCSASWERVLGLQTELVGMEEEAYAKMLRSNTFEVACGTAASRWGDGLEQLEIMRRGGAENFSGWGDVRYNRQMDGIWEESDPVLREALIEQADAWLFRDGNFAVCPLLYLGVQYDVASDVTGVGCGFDGRCSVLYAERA